MFLIFKNLIIVTYAINRDEKTKNISNETTVSLTNSENICLNGNLLFTFLFQLSVDGKIYLVFPAVGS